MKVSEVFCSLTPEILGKKNRFKPDLISQKYSNNCLFIFWERSESILKPAKVK